MPKDASYHTAAIRYNEELAVFAEGLAKQLENDEIKRWARSVSRQHKLHAGHHRKALKRLKNSFRGRKHKKETHLTEEHPKSIEQEQADFAARMEAQDIAGGGGSADPEDTTTPAPSPVENDPTPEPAPEPVEDNPDPEDAPEPVSTGVGTTGNQAGGTTA